MHARCVRFLLRIFPIFGGDSMVLPPRMDGFDVARCDIVPCLRCMVFAGEGVAGAYPSWSVFVVRPEPVLLPLALGGFPPVGLHERRLALSMAPSYPYPQSQVRYPYGVDAHGTWH